MPGNTNYLRYGKRKTPSTIPPQNISLCEKATGQLLAESALDNITSPQPRGRRGSCLVYPFSFDNIILSNTSCQPVAISRPPKCPFCFRQCQSKQLVEHHHKTHIIAYLLALRKAFDSIWKHGPPQWSHLYSFP